MTRRRSPATRRQSPPPDRAWSKDGHSLERPVGAESFWAEAGELCGSAIDLRRTDHKAGDPQGDHDERGHGDEPVERERGPVEDDILGARGRQARRT